MKLITKLLLGVALTTLNSTWLHATTTEVRNPEVTTKIQKKTSVKASKFMVTAANPYAVEAGYEILKQGGSAIDAAIAVQMVLTLVEPQSSGIGGGGFMLHWDASEKKLESYDGRETAPLKANSKLFVENKKPMNWWEALAGGRSVGVPGLLKMLEEVHQKYGKLPWNSLFTRAIELAEEGFIVSERLHNLVARKMNPALGRYDEAWYYFFPGGEPVEAGTLLQNPELADTFRRIASQGSNAFYKGSIANDIIKTVQQATDNPGALSNKDFNLYEVKQHEPACIQYRQYHVCGMGTPVAGSVVSLQILSILRNKPFDKDNGPTLDNIHWYTQAAKLAYADRGMYLGDPEFVEVPLSGLFDPSYIQKRTALMSKQDMGKAAPGKPLDLQANFQYGDSPELPSTSHMSIVDADGSAISMTSSIEMAFGSTLMVRGFLLNNQLTDFSFTPEKEGQLVANRVQGGKRPRSSMSPMMIFDNQKQLVMVIGSPGGSRIINYVTQTIISVVDWGMDIQDAIDSPRFVNRNGATDLEIGTDLVQYKEALEALGHKVNIRDLNSGLHGIVIRDGILIGGADSRREGIAMGE